MDWLFSGEESPAFTNDAKETTETTAATSSKTATITKNLKFARSSRMIRRLSSFEWFVFGASPLYQNRVLLEGRTRPFGFSVAYWLHRTCKQTHTVQ